MRHEDSNLRSSAAPLDATVGALVAAANERDQTAEGHSQRVTRFSVAVGKAMGLSDSEIEDLKYAAGLHDIGKIAISKNIINKLGKLTDEEFSVMKQHSLIALRILDKVDGLEGATPMIKHHHERWDGKGYPDGLAGDQIPVGARIIAAAEAFDILTSNVPWKESMSVEQAIEEIESCSGTQFDPLVVESMKTAWDKGYFEV